MTPAELIGRVPDLPSLPEVYFQVDRVLRDPDANRHGERSEGG
ncbi:MAG: hypothetical protein AB2812_01800 [Candidatus Sedimenticola endophacoides]